jgi:hypothetical protein
MKYWKIRPRVRPTGVEDGELCRDCFFSWDKVCPEDCENIVSWIEPSELKRISGRGREEKN